MLFLTLEEMSKNFFLVSRASARNPVYKEGSSYLITDNEGQRSSTGIVYLKTCDMTITFLNRNSQYKFKKNSLVLLPETSKYYSIFTNVSDETPTFHCINTNLYLNTFTKFTVEMEPYLLFEDTPESIKNLLKAFVATSYHRHYIIHRFICFGIRFSKTHSSKVH